MPAMPGEKLRCDNDETMVGQRKGRLLNSSVKLYKEAKRRLTNETKSKEPETKRTMLVLRLRGFNAEEMFLFLSKVMKLTKWRKIFCQHQKEYTNQIYTQHHQHVKEKLNKAWYMPRQSDTTKIDWKEPQQSSRVAYKKHSRFAYDVITNKSMTNSNTHD